MKHNISLSCLTKLLKTLLMNIELFDKHGEKKYYPVYTVLTISLLLSPIYYDTQLIILFINFITNWMGNGVWS